jgi:hypothetical protein
VDKELAALLPTGGSVAEFRNSIQSLENAMVHKAEAGEMEDCLKDCKLSHYFAPHIEGISHTTYARELWMPKGSVIIGKIHKHAHINIISEGVVSVVTEHGTQRLTAPCTFVSEVGLKRAVYIEEDTRWTTIHLTRFKNEDDMNNIEDEVIAKSYDELALLGQSETGRLT